MVDNPFLTTRQGVKTALCTECQSKLNATTRHPTLREHWCGSNQSDVYTYRFQARKERKMRSCLWFLFSYSNPSTCITRKGFPTPTPLNSCAQEKNKSQDSSGNGNTRLHAYTFARQAKTRIRAVGNRGQKVLNGPTEHTAPGT